MSERAYKTMTSTGAGSLVLGIILLVTGLAAGLTSGCHRIGNGHRVKPFPTEPTVETITHKVGTKFKDQIAFLHFISLLLRKKYVNKSFL